MARHACFIAVSVDGVVGFHIVGDGNYATLCGLDGDDPSPAVQQRIAELPNVPRIDCVNCWRAFVACQQLRLSDFSRVVRRLR